MLLLNKLGLAGLRKMFEAEQRTEPGPDDGLAGQVRQRSNLSRKSLAAAKLRVEAQTHKGLIESHVCKYYEDPSIRSEILKHVDGLKNLQRQVTNQVAVCYTRPAARTIRSVDDEQVANFLSAYAEAKTDLHAERWNRHVFFLSVVHVVPRYEADRLTWITVLPDKADVLFDPIGEEEPSVLIYESASHGAKWVAVDSQRWWWIRSDWTLIQEEEHGLGLRPWVALRWQQPPGSDYWDAGAGQDLLDGTLELGRVYAHARWVRKNWAKKTVSVHRGGNVHVPANQNMSANQPIDFIGEGQSRIDVHDLTIGMEGFRLEMREIVESVLEQYGLSANVVDFSTASTEDAANVFAPAAVAKHDQLSKIRDQQAKFLEDAELELAVRANILLRLAGRSSLTDQQVRMGFRCKHAQMTFADHPKARVATYKEQLSLGLVNPYEIYQAENPGMTFEEAREYVRDNVKYRAEFYEFWIASNMPLDPSDDLRTAAQLNGKLGGQSKSTNNDDDEKDETP